VPLHVERWTLRGTRADRPRQPSAFRFLQALERERAELPGQLAGDQKELDATPPEQRERRERLAWQIRRVEKRMAEVAARLTVLGESR